jgi:hypothetical protein
VAVRFSADGQDYTHTLSLGALSQFTVSCWFKVNDRNNFSTPWCIDTGNNTNAFAIQTHVDGTTLTPVDSSTSDKATAALTSGVWYWFGVRYTGTTGSWRYKALTDTAITAQSWTGMGQSTVTATTLRIGESAWGGEWLDGNVAGFKMWSGVSLTDAELDMESLQYRPSRTANLVCWYPLIRPAEVPSTTNYPDYSGNGRTLNGTLPASAQEDGPNLRWGIGRSRVIYPLSAGPSTFNVNLSDPIGVTDTLSRVWSGQRTISDPIGVTDTRTAALTDRNTLADPIGITDSLSAVKANAKSVSDPIGITDALAIQKLLARTVSDSIGLTDVQTRVTSYVRTLSETLSLTDVATPSGTATDPDGFDGDITIGLLEQKWQLSVAGTFSPKPKFFESKWNLRSTTRNMLIGNWQRKWDIDPK